MPKYRIFLAISFWLEVLKNIFLSFTPFAIDSIKRYLLLGAPDVTQETDPSIYPTPPPASMPIPTVYILPPTVTRLYPVTVTALERVYGPTSYVENVYDAITQTDLLFPDFAFPWHLFRIDEYFKGIWNEIDLIAIFSPLIGVICGLCLLWLLHYSIVKKNLISVLFSSAPLDARINIPSSFQNNNSSNSPSNDPNDDLTPPRKQQQLDNNFDQVKPSIKSLSAEIKIASPKQSTSPSNNDASAQSTESLNNNSLDKDNSSLNTNAEVSTALENNDSIHPTLSDSEQNEQTQAQISSASSTTVPRALTFEEVLEQNKIHFQTRGDSSSPKPVVVNPKEYLETKSIVRIPLDTPDTQDQKTPAQDHPSNTPVKESKEPDPHGILTVSESSSSSSSHSKENQAQDQSSITPEKKRKRSDPYGTSTASSSYTPHSRGDQVQNPVPPRPSFMCFGHINLIPSKRKMLPRMLRKTSEYCNDQTFPIFAEGELPVKRIRFTIDTTLPMEEDPVTTPSSDEQIPLKRKRVPRITTSSSPTPSSTPEERETIPNEEPTSPIGEGELPMKKEKLGVTVIPSTEEEEEDQPEDALLRAYEFLRHLNTKRRRSAHYPEPEEFIPEDDPTVSLQGEKSLKKKKSNRPLSRHSQNKTESGQRPAVIIARESQHSKWAYDWRPQEVNTSAQEQEVLATVEEENEGDQSQDTTAPVEEREESGQRPAMAIAWGAQHSKWAYGWTAQEVNTSAQKQEALATVEENNGDNQGQDTSAPVEDDEKFEHDQGESTPVDDDKSSDHNQGTPTPVEDDKISDSDQGTSISADEDKSDHNREKSTPANDGKISDRGQEESTSVDNDKKSDHDQEEAKPTDDDKKSDQDQEDVTPVEDDQGKSISVDDNQDQEELTPVDDVKKSDNDQEESTPKDDDEKSDQDQGTSASVDDDKKSDHDQEETTAVDDKKESDPDVIDPSAVDDEKKPDSPIPSSSEPISSTAPLPSRPVQQSGNAKPAEKKGGRRKGKGKRNRRR